MNDTVLPSPRPTPRFYPEAQTFSTKKLRPEGTPRDHIPPRPPVKSCPPLSRIFPRRNIVSQRAQPVSFRHSSEGSVLSPRYNENSNDLYFQQLFDNVTPIGYGSFGEVFKCRSKEDGCYYAVKKSREPFKGQYDRKRKLEEVAKHESLKPHPNCIKFFKAWEEKGHLYIQTELCKMSVHEFCESHQHLSEGLIWKYMVDLLMATKHLHDHNLIHMDIKPENAFISFDDVCKLGDFGLVIDLTKKKEVSNATEGDPKYLAQEALDGKMGKFTDIFAIGIFVLEMLTDLDPPRGGDHWHKLRNGELPDELLKDRSENIKMVVRKMLDPNYLRRPTVDQLLALPCIRDVLKTRLKGQVLPDMRLTRSLRSDNPNLLAPPPQLFLNQGSPQKKGDKDSTFSDEEMEDRGSHSAGSDLLNSSDEFVMPSNPPPRRAFTTPAIRRRPATSCLNGSPIKRLLFTDNVPSTPSTSHSSPVSSENHDSPHDPNDRSSTPPGSRMDWDEPKPGIEPKNLLGMFEAASDEED